MENKNQNENTVKKESNKKKWSSPIIEKAGSIPLMKVAFANCGTCYD